MTVKCEQRLLHNNKMMIKFNFRLIQVNKMQTGEPFSGPPEFKRYVLTNITPVPPIPSL